MCLAVPGKIVKISGETADIDFGGVTRQASLMVLPAAKIGDYVLVHAGFAIQIVNEKEAAETLKIFSEIYKT